MNIMDWLDDWIVGPMNCIDRLEGLFYSAKHRDMGHRMKIKYHDRGGKHSRQEIIDLLKLYGIDTFGHTHDANHMYMKVKIRQAKWAEYLLLHAGAALVSEQLDGRNADYVAQKEAGWMPISWASKRRKRR